VLPVTNMSGDPEQEYFADGITEDIITDQSKVSGLTALLPQAHQQGAAGASPWLVLCPWEPLLRIGRLGG
jgi:hypothetical protein